MSKSQEETSSLRSLLSAVLFVGLAITLATTVIIVVGWKRGSFGAQGSARGRGALLAALFAGGGVALAIACYAIAGLEPARRRRSAAQDAGAGREGKARALTAARLYTWATFAGVIAVSIVCGGYRSALWLLLAWPVALAGTLLRPTSGMLAAAGAVAIYGGVAWAEVSGWYVPLWMTDIQSFPFFVFAFGWLMLIAAVGVLNYLTGTRTRRALARLHFVASGLDTTRQELSERVAEHTAQLAEREAQLRLIAEVTQAAAATREPAQLLERVVTLVAQRLDFYHVGVFLLDATGEWAVLRAASSEGGRQMLARQHRLRVGLQGIVGYVAETGLPRFAYDVGEDSVWLSNPDLPETRSEIGLPLVVAEHIIGVLDIQTQEAEAFDEEDVETLRVLANSIATAINNARLLEETRNARERLERYEQADAVLAWRRALARRGLRLGYRYSSDGIQAVDVDSVVDTTIAGQVPEDGSAARVDVSVDQGGRTGDGRLLGNDVFRVETLDGVVRQTTADGRHLLVAPVTAAGRRFGVLSFERAVPWSDEAVRLVEAVISQLDLALNNARLLEETRLRAMQETARSEIVGRVRALASTDAILRSAAEELGRALHVERSRIQLIQHGEQHDEATYGD